MLNFMEYKKNKIVEAFEDTIKIPATPEKSSDKFASWKNLIKKVSEYKTKESLPKNSSEKLDNGFILKSNIGFTIESQDGKTYDFTYASTSKRKTDVPLYYVKSNDVNIKNDSKFILIEDKDMNNIKSIFGVLKSWNQNQKNENKIFSYLLEELNTFIDLNKYSMVQIGDPNGEFKNYNRFNEINYTINRLLFGSNSKYKLKDMRYSEFIKMEKIFQPISKKNELPTSSNWYVEKKMKNVQGDENYFPIKFGKSIKTGDFLNIHKNIIDGEEIEIKVLKITEKNK